MSCARPRALLRGPAFLMPLYSISCAQNPISPEDVIERTGFFINPHNIGIHCQNHNLLKVDTSKLRGSEAKLGMFLSQASDIILAFHAPSFPVLEWLQVTVSGSHVKSESPTRM